MEWTHYRALFKTRYRRKLCHETYAFLQVSEEGERIEIHLYNKRILTLYPNGSFTPENHGYWTSPITRDRFRRYIPWHGHTSSWRFDAVEFATTGKVQPSPRRVWTVWLSGAGSHPWANETIYDSSGWRDDLPRELNELNANELVSSITPFAKKTIDALVGGDLGDTCSPCREAMLLGDWPPEEAASTSARRWAGHLYEDHIKTQMPSRVLMDTAAICSKRPKHQQAVRLLDRENWVLWKKPRSKKQFAEKMERTFAGELDECADLGAPLGYKRTLRWDLERYLLELFGFEIGG